MQDIFLTIVIVLVGVVILVLVLKNLFQLSSKQASQKLVQDVEMKIRTLLPELQKQTTQSLIDMADQKLGAEKKEIKTDLENKRYEIERLVKAIKENLNETDKRLNRAEKERVGSFKELSERLQKHNEKLQDQREITERLRVTADNLRKVLSDNQLRGQFGEQVAEDLLKMIGFVEGVNYEMQESQTGGDGRETRPDITIKLPDDTKINVDAKFPYSNLQKLTETEDEAEKKSYIKAFETDVKEKIKQVTTRDYINPDENTVDFVILFIPNEMIFSYIYDKMNDIWTDAMNKKVVLAGPFSFTAILRMVMQSHEYFRYQSNVRETIHNIQIFEKEFKKWNAAFNKIGTRIEGLQKQYNEVATTRTNQLERRMEKVKLEDAGEKKQLELGAGNGKKN